MQDILKRWYRGALFPTEEIRPDTEEYKAVFRRLHADFQQIKTFLPAEQQERLQQMKADMYFLSDADCYENFVYGFRLGAGLMYETFLLP